MKTTIVVIILIALIISIIVISNSKTNTNLDRNWVIEIAIYSRGMIQDSYVIQIDENNTIRIRSGSGRNFTAIPFHEKFLSEIYLEEESILSDDELQTLLSLAQELEGAGVMNEPVFGSGTRLWEVVLLYNSVQYVMDYSLASLIVNHLGETFHDGAYSIDHYEIFIRLVDEITQLSPIEIALR